MDPEDKLRWRHNILGTVAALSDIDFQRATWLDPKMQNPAFTYVEFTNSFYDFCGGYWKVTEKDAEEAPFAGPLDEGVISELERDLFWDLHLALLRDEQPDDYDHEAILNSASWIEVVRVAGIVVEKLKNTLKSPEDLAMLENKLPPEEQKRWP